MALLKTYFDISTKGLVCGAYDQTPYALPPLRQEETPTFDITMLRRFRQTKPYFEKVSFGGWIALIAIGTRAGTVHTSGTSSTLSADNYTFRDLALPLNTAGINGLTDGQDGIFIEFRFTDSATGYYFGKSFPIKIEKAVATSGATITATTDRALTVAEAQLGYVRYRSGAGRGIEIPSQSGLRSTILWTDDDGGFHTDSV